MERSALSSAVISLSLALCVAGVAANDQTGSSRPVPSRGSRPLATYRVPAGSPLLLKLRTPLDSASTLVGQQVEAVLWSPVIKDGIELIPVDSRVFGTVVEVRRTSRRHRLGAVVCAFSVITHPETHSYAAISTRHVSFDGGRHDGPEAHRGRRPRTPVEAVVPVDEPFVAVLTEPLVVFVPK